MAEVDGVAVTGDLAPSAPLLRKSFKIEEGRMMREGTNEILVGDGVDHAVRLEAAGPTGLRREHQRRAAPGAVRDHRAGSADRRREEVDDPPHAASTIICRWRRP